MYEYLDKRYALALYEVAEEKGKVEEFIDDLRQVVELMKNNDDFMAVVKHPEISTSRKKQLFENIFKGNMDDDLLTFLLILIDKDRINYLEEKLIEMEKIDLERKNTLMANVKTVVPMSDVQKRALIGKLERKFDKKVVLNEEIDRNILGGVYVRVGNDVIDGTVKLKLDEMKKMMLKRE